MKSRRERIKEAVKMIAGYEETIRMALSAGDKDVAKELEKSKWDAYKKLKELVYGAIK